MKTYHDIFVEQLIRRYRPGGETVFKCGAVLIGLILITLAFVLLRSFFPILFALVVILEFFAFVYTVKEFEYSFINGDLDIDMIQGKRKRKTVFSVSSRDIVLLAPCGSHSEALQEQFARTLDASIGEKVEDRWFFVCKRQDGTAELVYFHPNQRLLAAFKGSLGSRMDYSLSAAHTDIAD